MSAYKIIGNSIDGFCSYQNEPMSHAELLAYLQDPEGFIKDFNVSRGEFDVAVYLDVPELKIRRKYGYYLEGQKKFRVIFLSYMTADALTSVTVNGNIVTFTPKLLKTRNEWGEEIEADADTKEFNEKFLKPITVDLGLI